MRFPAFLSLSLVLLGSIFLLSSAQALTVDQFKTIVRIQIVNDQDGFVSYGSGTLIDADGRILTNAKVVEQLQKYPSYTATICVTANEVDAPKCMMRATLLKTKPVADLALLQIRSVHLNNAWISPEEYALRTGFKFSFAKPDPTVLTTEEVKLGDNLNVLTYTATTTATLTQLSTEVGGFVRGTVKGKSVPNFVKVGTKITNGLGGGGVFTSKGKFVGIPAYNKDATAPNGTFVSLPVINTFLKEALGASYLTPAYPFALTGALDGTQAGFLQTNSCPAYATVNAGNSVCRCNDGFFAVGNACISGTTYCPLAYGTTARYDDYLKSCFCATATTNGVCVKTPPKPAPAPTKPVTPTTPTATTTKPVVTPKTFSCPAHASYNAKSWACECDKGWIRDTKKNVCVAKPVTVKK